MDEIFVNLICINQTSVYSECKSWSQGGLDRFHCVYIYINIWKSSQRINLRDVGSETSVNDTVQTNKNDK